MERCGQGVRCLPPSSYPFDISKVHTIKAILSVFEAGTAVADYSAIAILKDGAGVSYGKHQATDGGGSLDAIVQVYVDSCGPLAGPLAPYLPRLARNETAGVDPDHLPQWVDDLVDLLRHAGRDTVMQRAQDQVFDDRYWEPAVEQVLEMGLVDPLSWAVVYDTCIHSGPSGVWNIRKRFPGAPPSGGGCERAWTEGVHRSTARVAGLKCESGGQGHCVPDGRVPGSHRNLTATVP